MAFPRLYVSIVVVILISLGLVFVFLYQCPHGYLKDYPPPSFALPYISKDEIVRVPQMWSPPNHLGVDFEGKMDTRFCAVCNGEITSISKYVMNGYGTWAITINLKINPTYSAIYVFEPDTTEESIADLQLQKIAVKVGDKVTTGQLIGKLYAHGGYPHLHFVVSKNGEWVDPFPYFTEEAQKEIMELHEKI